MFVAYFVYGVCKLMIKGVLYLDYIMVDLLQCVKAWIINHESNNDNIIFFVIQKTFYCF